MKHKRRIKLIRPRLQLKLIGWFLGVATLALLMQYLLFAWSVSELAATSPDGSATLSVQAPTMLLRALLLSFLFLLPLIALVGVLVTFRIAGPVYRFETYLGQIARGEEVGPCRIRDGDELWELCSRINEAVAALRAQRDLARATEPRDRGTRDPLRAAS